MIPMESYYGTSKLKSLAEPGTKQNSWGSAFVTGIAITGFIATLVVIALSAVNIYYSAKSDGFGKQINHDLKTMYDQVSDNNQYITAELGPKTNLINNMVSYSIPSQLAKIQTLIKNDVMKACMPQFSYNQTTCPVVQDARHSKYYSPINLNVLSTCRSNLRSLQLMSSINFVDYPSFIPGPTKPGGCTRIPTFSLSTTLFGYGHNIIANGCQDHSSSDQYFTIGRITDQSGDVPYLSKMQEWYLNDGLNRKSCSIAAGLEAVWAGCNIVTQEEREDYLNAGIMKISIIYMDIYGRKVEWIYDQNEIAIDHEYNAIYFSVGSGVVIDDHVYFLMYGGLTQSINVNARCVAPGCVNPSQSTCNSAQKPSWLYGHQIVNAVLDFNATFNDKPHLRIRTISPSEVWLGSEGRLIYNSLTQVTYIYTRSQTWHVYPQIGTIDIKDNLHINWVTNTAVTRPAPHPCGALSRCPQLCFNGIYTDIFPLGKDFEYGITVYLSATNTRSSPQVAFINSTNILYSRYVTTDSQGASYTTTSCFNFKSKIWCVSIVEITPATVGEFEPIPLLYSLDLQCSPIGTGIAGRDSKFDNFTIKPPPVTCQLQHINDSYTLQISSAEQHQVATIIIPQNHTFNHDQGLLSAICGNSIDIDYDGITDDLTTKLPQTTKTIAPTSTTKPPTTANISNIDLNARSAERDGPLDYIMRFILDQLGDEN